jgi:hypothetical protein
MEGEGSKELAALDASRVSALESFNMKSGIVRDRVSQVIRGMANGAYIFGPPGTGKTYNTRSVAEQMGATYAYQNGHLTPKGFYELLDDHAAELIVLDDVSSLLNSPQSLNLLLAALGGQPGGERVIKYDTAYESRSSHFSGGIIVLSNLRLRDAPLQQALMSRVQAFEFDPEPEEIEAFLRDHLENGSDQLGLDGKECNEVLDHIVAECDRYGCRLDFRLVLDKGLKDYRFWRDKESETHWRDLISSSIKQRADTIAHSQAGLGRADRVRAETVIAGRIRAEHADRASQVAAWTALTGKSERALYRRLKQV